MLNYGRALPVPDCKDSSTTLGMTESARNDGLTAFSKKKEERRKKKEEWWRRSDASHFIIIHFNFYILH